MRILLGQFSRRQGMWSKPHINMLKHVTQLMIALKKVFTLLSSVYPAKDYKDMFIVNTLRNYINHGKIESLK